MRDFRCMLADPSGNARTTPISLYDSTSLAEARHEWAMLQLDHSSMYAVSRLGLAADASQFMRRCFRETQPLNHSELKPQAPIHSRALFVEPAFLDRPHSLRSVSFLRDSFLNYMKILRVLVDEINCRGLIEFATHSAARRALDNPHPKGYRLRWVSPDTLIPPADFTRSRTLPVFGDLATCELPAPSTDWRRPRPTQSSEFLATLVTVARTLAGSGAFDDDCDGQPGSGASCSPRDFVISVLVRQLAKAEISEVFNYPIDI